MITLRVGIFIFGVVCEQKVIYYFVSVHWELFQNGCDLSDVLL